MKALYAVCDSSKDKDQTTRSVLEAMGRMPAAERRQVLPVLAELGTPAALEAAQAATREQDAELAKEAVRVLGQWPNASPAPMLLELARTTAQPLRSACWLCAAASMSPRWSLTRPSACRCSSRQGPPPRARRRRSRPLARSARFRPPRRSRSRWRTWRTRTLRMKPASAAITIAEQLATSDAQLAGETAAKLLEQCKIPDITKRAMAIRIKSAGPGPFIQDWLVCGPFSQPGVEDLSAIFKLALRPREAGRESAMETHAPRGRGQPGASCSPAMSNCAAYLKTQIVVPEDCDAFLLLGSDDGVKAWLNRAVVQPTTSTAATCRTRTWRPSTSRRAAMT